MKKSTMLVLRQSIMSCSDMYSTFSGPTIFYIFFIYFIYIYIFYIFIYFLYIFYIFPIFVKQRKIYFRFLANLSENDKYNPSIHTKNNKLIGIQANFRSILKQFEIKLKFKIKFVQIDFKFWYNFSLFLQLQTYVSFYRDSSVQSEASKNIIKIERF